jgi:hypothetical protein
MLCAVFRNMVIFYGEELLAPCPTPKLEDHPCRLSTTAYSMYSQLPSISGGRSSICNLRTHHAVVTGTHYYDKAGLKHVGDSVTNYNKSSGCIRE